MGQAMAPVMVVAAIASEIGKGVAETSAARSEEQALKLRQEESTIQSQQKQLDNYDLMQKTLDAQTAKAAASGYALSSPSFNAMQRDTFNTGVKENKNLELEAAFEKENIDIEKDNVRKSLHAKLFGDAVSIGEGLANFFENKPGKS